ncbi:MAG: porin [Bacteroidales bacterium]
MSALAETPADSAKNKKPLPEWLPKISGTLRAKGEYQTRDKEGRFEVRNARVAFDGNVTPIVIYRAEVDLSDEGRIRMLDAYAGVLPVKGLTLRIGQMRVPFSIDAHRSPHKQYFANRSFIAKQVGDVRDVGLCASYTLPKTPLTIEGGLFNGSGLTDQKDYWTKNLNFSAKVQWKPVKMLTLQGSVQKISPTGGMVMLYDGGVSFNHAGVFLEAEYLRKHYKNNAYHAVNALNTMAAYTLPLRRVFDHLRFLTRFDMMDDHSRGALNDEGVLQTDDAARKRLTAGITLGFAKRIAAELRLNYEKYFYDKGAAMKTSERDKVVMEMMIHF